jgi:hypothetical protein
MRGNGGTLNLIMYVTRPGPPARQMALEAAARGTGRSIE